MTSALAPELESPPSMFCTHRVTCQTLHKVVEQTEQRYGIRYREDS